MRLTRLIHEGIQTLVGHKDQEGQSTPSDVKNIHEDESAGIGDIMFYVRPKGELFGYDSETSEDEIVLDRMVYKKRARYTDGRTEYGWRQDEMIFIGTIDEWEEFKREVEQNKQEQPKKWPKIVEHVERFLEKHGNQLNNPRCPQGTSKV